MAENTFLSSSFDPLTLALSILMLILILSAFFIKKLDPLTFALYSISILTTWFIYKEKGASNTSILYSFYLLFIYLL